jgi:hypothetical protein
MCFVATAFSPSLIDTFATGVPVLAGNALGIDIMAA